MTIDFQPEVGTRFERPAAGTMTHHLDPARVAALLGLEVEPVQREEAPQAPAQAAPEAQQAALTMHEVRSISVGLASTAGLLADPTLPDAMRERLTQLLVEETCRLQRRVRPDADAERAPQPGARARVALDRVVARVCDLHEVRGTHVTLAQPVERTWTSVPEDVVVEVVGALLENAARHAPGARVRVSATRVAGGLRVRVSDDGPGVDPLLVPHVFEAWARRAGSPGQGLGLASARDLVRTWGGDLRLVAREGGATWDVLLPETSSPWTGGPAADAVAPARAWDAHAPQAAAQAATQAATRMVVLHGRAF
ncbi:sensor histidine kinase [Nocardioides sp. GY 10127]|uniref:sensor histidine kinase n=1 Tax=Nocardioides sp. GY 10127 TaxID=2569762 RepID=UPI0010A78EB6|nr:sensor histidine kinase [Nocardioides sp. GY 10127]TIC81807.1 hypothetical protein E8D37_11550 [Nocardioides sp. GY 10127]